MKRIKGIKVLSAMLLDFIEEIIYSISSELERIGRGVAFAELKYCPFIAEVSPYLDVIYLDEQGEIILDSCFADISEKRLRDCISELEIDAFGLLNLLELLKSVAGKNGALPSILTPLAGEYISHEPQDRDAWLCVCGNTPATGGFYACDDDGDLIEPGGDWEYLYRCESCGRVIDDRDHQVIGINLNPNKQEE